MLDEACRDFLPEGFAQQQDSQGTYRDIRLKEQQIDCRCPISDTNKKKLKAVFILDVSISGPVTH